MLIVIVCVGTARSDGSGETQRAVARSRCPLAGVIPGAQAPPRRSERARTPHDGQMLSGVRPSGRATSSCSRVRLVARGAHKICFERHLRSRSEPQKMF